MAVLKMQKISICALKKDRKAILEQLQHLGVLEVDREKEEDAFFQKMDTTGQRMKFEKAATAADQALGILDAYAPEKKSLLSSLEGKELIDRELEEKVQISGPELIKTARGIYDLDREYAELRAGIAKIENQIESLMPWMALDVPLQEGKTKRTALILGTMPGELTLENIYSILLEKTPEVMEKTGVDVHLVSAESNMICIAVICLKEQLQTVEEALRSVGFARPSQNWSKTPKEQKEVLETEIAASRERMTQCEAELKAVADYYRVRADKYAVLGDLLQSKRTFVISGYIPACESGPVEKSLTEKYNCMVDIEDIEEGEEAPVILKNNPFSTNMEGIVESYGLPHNDHVILLRIFLRNDVVRCSVWSSCCNCVCDSCEEISKNVTEHGKIFETVLLLWSIYTCMGRSIWRIFWKYRRHCFRKILRTYGNSSGTLVCSIE